MEKTLVFIKPDALSQRAMGNVIALLEKNSRIVALKMLWMNRNQAKRFYSVHKGKSFWEPLVGFISSNPIVVMVLEGKNVISRVRKIIGDTDPAKSRKGTVRKIYARDNRHNIIHSSDSKKLAGREIKLFFRREEIYSWQDRDYHL